MQGNGASSCVRTFRTIDIGNRKISLGKLTFKDFATAKEQAAAEYKRSLIQTYTKNMDLVPEDQKANCIAQAFEKAEQITADSLPPKQVWMPKRDQQSGKILKNIGERYYHNEARKWIEKDSPLIFQQEIEYSGWWLAETNMGRMFATWLSISKCPGQEEMTLDDVAALFQDNEDELEEAANEVGKLSQQKLGNEQPPAESVGA